MILNQEAIKQIGFKNEQDAIGKTVVIDWQGENYRWEIIGVVKNFHFKDLHSEIEPYGFQLNNVLNTITSSHMQKRKYISSVLTSIGNAWNRLNPNEPFEYSFLDDDFQKNYEADIRLGSNRKKFYHHCYFNFLSWIIWSCHLQCRTAYKRNWCTEKYWEQVLAMWSVYYQKNF